MISGAGSIFLVNNGLQVKIVATSSGGTLIYGDTTSPDFADFPFLQVTNQDTGTLELRVEAGAVGADNEVPVQCPPGDTRVALSGRPFNGTYTIKAYCATANKLFVSGYVARYHR